MVIWKKSQQVWTWSLLLRVRERFSVLATRVSSIFFTIFEISLQNQTYYFLTNLYRCVKARNNQNKNPANKHFIGTRAKQSPCAPGY